MEVGRKREGVFAERAEEMGEETVEGDGTWGGC